MACDNNYLSPFETALKSILCYHENINIFLLTNEDLQLNLEYLEKILLRKNSKITLVKIDNYIDKENDGYISKATYLRYFIPNLFSFSENNRWLYLDCDLIVNENLENVFEREEFQQYPLLAVREFCSIFNGFSFNAGVLFINSKLWNVSERELFEYNMKNINLNDQEVLNYFFKDRWFQLEANYNFQEGYMRFSQKTKEIKIFHWSSGKKPFNEKTTLSEIYYFFKNLDWKRILQYKMEGKK